MEARGVRVRPNSVIEDRFEEGQVVATPRMRYSSAPGHAGDDFLGGMAPRVTFSSNGS